MLFSVGIQIGLGNFSTNLVPAAKLPQNRILPTLKTEPISSFSPPVKPKPIGISASSSSVAREASDSELDGKNEDNESDEKLRVVVKPLGRPRLVLKFIWMEKNIGIAIDQVIPGGYGTIPLSPYYFWPRKDAWAELRAMLERKPWISSKEKIVLLNQATDIINLWQQSGEDLA